MARSLASSVSGAAERTTPHLPMDLDAGRAWLEGEAVNLSEADVDELLAGQMLAESEAEMGDDEFGQSEEEEPELGDEEEEESE